jgi:hypothetical protein
MEKTKTEKPNIPSLQDLVSESDATIRENHLMVLLNQDPPSHWLSQHPTIKIKNERNESVPAVYLPINRVEYLLSRIFGKWWVEIRNTTIMANSVCVTVRVFVVNPVTKETEWNDGVGAAPIQTEKGAGAMDWNQAKSAGVQMALPAAESYAIKDACEKWGKLFGKDLNRKDVISYDSLLKTQVYYEDLAELFELKKDLLTPEELKSAMRILKNKEVASYRKLQNILKNK